MGASGLTNGLSHRWLLRLAAAGLAPFGAFVVVISSRWYGNVPAAILLAASIVLMFVYLVFWRELMVKTHQVLLLHEEWGDLRRLALFVGAFLTFPAVTLLPPVIVFAVASTLD